MFRGAPSEAVEEAVTGFAKRGVRSLAVGRTRGDDDHYEFAAIISFLDPPRADTEETIHRAFALGVDVKMITGAATSFGVSTNAACALSRLGLQESWQHHSMRGRFLF